MFNVSQCFLLRNYGKRCFLKFQRYHQAAKVLKVDQYWGVFGLFIRLDLGNEKDPKFSEKWESIVQFISEKNRRSRFMDFLLGGVSNIRDQLVCWQLQRESQQGWSLPLALVEPYVPPVKLLLVICKWQTKNIWELLRLWNSQKVWSLVLHFVAVSPPWLRTKS